MPKKLRHKLAHLTNTKKDLVWREVHWQKKKKGFSRNKACVHVCVCTRRQKEWQSINQALKARRKKVLQWVDTIWPACSLVSVGSRLKLIVFVVVVGTAAAKQCRQSIESASQPASSHCPRLSKKEKSKHEKQLVILLLVFCLQHLIPD